VQWMAHQESNGDPRRWESNVFHNNDADGHRGRFIIISGGYRVQVWDATSWEDAPMTWVENNHYIPDFTCRQRELYQIETLCENKQS
jgi:hypothetical protein